MREDLIERLLNAARGDDGLASNVPNALLREAAALEAAREDAQPVAWVAADTLSSPHPTCVSSLAYMSQLDRERGREYVPLYAAPPAPPWPRRTAMTDHYENIRKALAMGPTPGALTYGEDNDGWYIEAAGNQIGYCLSESDAALIAACDPDTIRALVEERDALAAALEAAREDAPEAYYQGQRVRLVPEPPEGG